MSKASEVTLIILGGVVGAIVITWKIWSSPDTSPLSIVIFTKTVLPTLGGGALAAGIGVYVLPLFDASNVPRRFFFAVVCGMCYPAVLSAAQRYVSTIASSVVAEKVTDAANQISNATTITDTQKASAQITKASQTISDALPRLASNDRSVADAAIRNALSNINASQATPETQSLIKVEAINQLGVIAVLPETKDAAIAKLDVLRDQNGGNAAITDSAQQAIWQINDGQAKAAH